MQIGSTSTSPVAFAAAARRRPSAVLFAAIVVAFFLPFGTVSCDGEKVSVTGMQLATATVPGAHTSADGPQNLAGEVESSGFFPAALALVTALAGVAVAWWRPAAIGKRFLLALSGMLLVLWLPLKASAELADVEPGVGWFLAFALFLAACVVELVALVRRRRERRGYPLSAPLLPDQREAGTSSLAA